MGKDGLFLFIYMKDFLKGLIMKKIIIKAIFSMFISVCIFNTAYADIFCASLRVPYDKQYKRVGDVVSKMKSKKSGKKLKLEISKKGFGKECFNLVVEKWVLLNALDIWNNSENNSSEIKEMIELLHRHNLTVKRIFERIDNKKESDVIKIIKNSYGDHTTSIWIDAIEMNKILNDKHYASVTISNPGADFPVLLEEFRDIILAELKESKKPLEFKAVAGISKSLLNKKIDDYSVARKDKHLYKKTTLLSALDILKSYNNQEIYELGLLLYETFGIKFNAKSKAEKKRCEIILADRIYKDKYGYRKIVDIIEQYMKKNPGKADHYTVKFIESIKGIYASLEKPNYFSGRGNIYSAL